MATEDIVVDPLSLQDFATRLQPRLQEAAKSLTTLSVSPGSDAPKLGGFYDAQLTVGRHQSLHDQFVQRLQRLVDAVDAASTATTAIMLKYQTVAQLNEASVQDLRSELLPVTEALEMSYGNA